MKSVKVIGYRLWIIGVLFMSTSVMAQGLAQRPEAQMKSTSVLVHSGSSLPQAAATGVYVTGSSPASYAPVVSFRPGHIRKVGEEGFEDETDPEVPTNPNPLGDALWPLMMMALLFGGVVAIRRRKAQEM